MPATPSFGCFARSPSQKLGACIIGTDKGGERKRLLALVPLTNGVTAPQPTALTLDASGALSPSDRAAAGRQLAGFVAWVPVATFDKDPNVTVGKWEFVEFTLSGVHYLKGQRDRDGNDVRLVQAPAGGSALRLRAFPAETPDDAVIELTERDDHEPMTHVWVEACMTTGCSTTSDL